VMAPTFSNIWLADALERVLNPQLPELINSDGHAVVICTSTFPFKEGATAAACRKALARLPNVVRSGTNAFDWLSDRDEKPRPSVSKGSENVVTLLTTMETGETVLGSIEIKKNTVILSTNSRERANAGETMIAAALEGFVGTLTREEMTAG